MKKLRTQSVSSAPLGTEGFTLVEVMVGFFIFALAMTSVVWMMIMAQRMGESARNRIAALQHARASVEELLSESYGGSDLDVGSHSVSRGGFTGRYVVTEPDANQRKRVVMTYDYPSFGSTAQVELQLDISNALH